MTTPTNNTVAPLDLAQFDGHTPGPWHVTTLGPALRHMIGARVNRVAVTYNDCSDSAQDEANARLIAAAPAMLSELRTLRARNAELEEHSNAALLWLEAEARQGYPVNSMASHAVPAICKGLRAALARAKEGRAE